MPYKIYKRDNKWCVKNSETDEDKGCSENRTMALAHMRALYAHEKKEATESELDSLVMKACAEYQVETGDSVAPEEILESKGIYVEADSFGDLSTIFGATSYEELDEQRSAREKRWKIESTLDDFPTLASNVIASPFVEDKAEALQGLGTELADRVRKISSEDMESKAISKREDVSEADKKRAVGEYGSVTYADERNKKYPVDSEAHIRAAWSYINMPKNQKKYSSGEVSAIKRKVVAAWKRKIDKKGPPSMKDFGGFIEQVTFALKDMFGGIDQDISELDDVEVKEETNGGLLSFKNKDGKWIWFARYSNNFRDNDNPPEIITASSHRRFVERVEKGLAPYPELWLWHEKSWRLGKATWVGYDDTGFALSAGYYYPGCENVAEAMSKAKDIRVSHGMPISSLVRDETDDSLIVGHDTLEVSPLPPWAAANMLTGFVSFNKGEEVNVSIPKEQKKKLAELDLGITEEMLAGLESLNISDAQKALNADVEQKEKEEDTTEAPAETADVSAVKTEEPEVTTPQTETTPIEEPEPEAEKSVEDEAPTRKELADALVNFLKPYMDNVESLQNEVKSLKEELVTHKTKEDTVAEQIVRTTPVASLMSLFSERVIKSEDAKIKDGDPLADAKGPEQAKDKEDRFGIPFLNDLTSPVPKQQ